MYANILEIDKAKNGVDEGNEEEEEADVDECWQRDDQREEQRADRLRALYETQHAADAHDTHDADDRRRDCEMTEHILETHSYQQIMRKY